MGGQASGGAAALWGRETTDGLARGGFAQGNQLDGEVGYGLPVGTRFVGTPQVGFSTSEYDRNYRSAMASGGSPGRTSTSKSGSTHSAGKTPMPGRTSNGVLGPPPSGGMGAGATGASGMNELFPPCPQRGAGNGVAALARAASVLTRTRLTPPRSTDKNSTQRVQGTAELGDPAAVRPLDPCRETRQDGAGHRGRRTVVRW